MKKNAHLVLTIIAIIILILSTIWYYRTRELEPLIGIFTSISGIIALIYFHNNEPDKLAGNQKQHLGDNSTGYQAGGDINIRK